jgi:hypothetical protein
VTPFWRISTFALAAQNSKGFFMAFGFSRGAGDSSPNRRHRKTKEKRLRKLLSRLSFERLEDRSLLSGNPISDSLGLSWPTPIAGQSFTIDATINGTLLTGTPRTGTLTLSEGGTSLAVVNLASTQANSAGQYLLTVPQGLALGTNALTVAYSGDTNYASATSNITLTVNNDLLSLSYSTLVITGQPYTVSAAISGPLLGGAARTGTLSLVEGTTTLASVNVATTTPSTSGYYALTVPAGFTHGTHNLKVTYSGDTTYSALTSNLATITAANDQLGLSNFGGSALLSQPYTLNVLISGPLINSAARTGTLSVVEGTTTLASLDVSTATTNASGAYTLTIPSGLALGSNLLKVTYSGDSTYDSSSLTAVVTGVNVLPTSVISSYSTAATAGQSYTVNSIVSGYLEPGLPRTGTLSLMEGTNTLASVNLATATPNSSGYYALTVAAGLSTGTHNLTVVYSGDTNYATSSQTLSTISSSVHLASDSLGLSWSTPLAGQSFTLNAIINGTLLAGTTRTGTITLSENGTTLASVNIATATANSSGYYALTVPQGLALGTNALTVTYSGDSNYASATSNITLSITNDSLALSYTTLPLTGQAYTVNVAINGTLVNGAARTGTLSLIEGTTTLASVNVATTTPSSSGYYALTVPAGLTAGAHTLKVTYSGDSNYAALTYNLTTITVANDQLLLSNFGSSTLIGQPFSIGVGINGALINGVARTGTISITEGTATLTSIDLSTATPNSSGVYTLSVPGGLAAGSNALKITYSGDSNYNSVSTTLTVSGVTSLPTSVVSSYSTSATVGQTYTVSSLISGYLQPGVTRTGTLSLMEGTTALASVNIATATPNSSGYYVLTVASGLPAGTHNLSVVYSGDANYATSTQTLSTITSAVHLISDSLGMSWSTPIAGQSFTLNASINGTLLAGAPRTGTITLSENGTTLASVNIGTTTANSSGYYALTVPQGLPLGTNVLTPSYSPTAF